MSPLRAGQDKTNDVRSSFAVDGVSEGPPYKTCLACGYLPRREQEVATRGPLGVLHHVVTGNYFVALHA